MPAGAGYAQRFAALDTRLVQVDGRVTLLQWMVGINLTVTLCGFSALFGLLWKTMKP